jgi:hypothetical protein
MRRAVIANAAIISAILFIVVHPLYAQSAGQQPAHQTAITKEDLDEFVALFRYFLYAAGLFVAILAALGVMFFGFDVRNAHLRIRRDTEELRELIEKATQFGKNTEEATRTLQDRTRDNIYKTEDMSRETLKKLQDLVTSQEADHQTRMVEQANIFETRMTEQTQFFEKRAAELSHFLIDAERRVEERLTGILDQVEETGATVQELSERQDAIQAPAANRQGRSDEQLIREVIAGSKFRWTTIGRIESKTRLRRDDILRLARSMTDIDISTGRDSKEPIFRFK